jgi:adenylate cyclase
MNFCPECGQPQPRATGALWVGERRPVTVLFADLASFTSVSEEADPEDVIDMLNQVFGRLMTECDREGGYLDKTVGDEMMVLFGAPRAHEDDPVRAVRAALAMQDAMDELYASMEKRVGTACKLHIGIDTGQVVWGQVGPPGRTTLTVIGDVVNLASRLEEFSAGGQIVVSEAVYLRTRRFFEYKLLESTQVRGKSGQIPVYAPIKLRSGVSARPWLVDTSIPLMERSREKETLSTHWEAAVSGRPQSVLVTGAAGLGKSRLLVEFLECVTGAGAYPTEKQPIVLHARFESAAGLEHYSPLVTLLHQVFDFGAEDTELVRRRKVEEWAHILGITDKTFVPLIGYLLGWYQDDARLGNGERDLSRLRARAVQAAATLFLSRSAQRPLLILVDDAQRADSASLEWMAQLSVTGREITEREFTPRRLMLVTAARPQSAVSGAALQVDRVITLAPLSEMARRDLIESLLPGQGLPLSLIDRISARSEGNLLYLIDATRGLEQSGQLAKHGGLWQLTRPVKEIDLPPSITELVMANLDSLSPEAREVLQHASVIGMRFDYAALAAISPVDNLDRVLAELEQRGLITLVQGNGDERVYAFAQLVVHEVAYDSILRKTRSDLHARIAHLAEKRPEPDSAQNLEALAHHYAVGGDSEKTLIYNWLAGQRVLAQYRFDDAYGYLRVAWEALPRAPGTDPGFHLLLAQALGDAATFMGNYMQAEECYQTARTLIGQNREELANLAYRMGRLRMYQNDTALASQSYEEALKLAGQDSTLAAQIEAELRVMFDRG